MPAFFIRAKTRAGQALVFPNRRFETAATCFDCCLSQEILDGGKGWLTT